MIQIERVHTYPVPLREGFAYITNLNNWANYWPNYVRIKDPTNARWSKSGDTVTLVIRLLNRERELNMVLDEFETETLVAYLSRQTGLPDAHHERHFRAVPQGFEYRLVVIFTPRPGLIGLFDRSLVRGAVAQAVGKTIRNLDTDFKQWQSTLSTKSTKGD